MSVNCCAPSAGTLPYKHKIVVAGNHELSFDDNFLQQSRIIGVRFHPAQVREYLLSKNLTKMKDLLVNCTYLEDSETTVFGLRVYGSPWYSELHLCRNLLLSYLLLDLFRAVPLEVDVPVTMAFTSAKLCQTRSLGESISLQRPKCAINLLIYCGTNCS